MEVRSVIVGIMIMPALPIGGALIQLALEETSGAKRLVS